MTTQSIIAHVSTGLMTGRLQALAGTDLTTNVELALNATGEQTVRRVVAMPVSFYRPCDVIGLDPTQILRTEPVADYSDFEPNYLAAVEFSDPGLPWRYTYDPGAEDKRTPWFTLIVLADDEFSYAERRIETLRDADDQPIAMPRAIVIPDSAVLPPLDEAGYWAHCHSSERVPTVEQSHLERDAVRARMLAARRLEPRTAYTAFVVPTYSCGVERGLDPSGSHTHSDALAWTDTTTAHTTPIYFEWSFTTSEPGDIEQIAERLVPTALSSEAGTQPMVVAPDETGLPPTPLRYEGALASSELADRPPQNPETTRRIVELLQTDDGTDLEGSRALAPPLYGRWNVRSPNVTQPGTWLNELNTSLTSRAAAGLGASLVREDQEELVAEAWRQFGEATAAQRRLCAAQLGLLTSSRLHQKMTETVAPESLSMIFRPVISKLQTAPGRTLARDIRNSNLAHIATGARTRVALAPNGRAQRSTVHGRDASAIVAAIASADFLASPTDQTIRDSALSQMIDAQLFAEPDSSESPNDDPVTAAAGFSTDGKVDTDKLRDFLTASTAPSATLPARINASIDGIDISTEASLCHARFPAPVFDRPMYEPLRDRSLSYLFPGIGDIPDNTSTLAESNQPFIEAFLAGANQELTSELIWRGVPTSLGSTLFSKFWDRVDGNDIDPISEWRKPLGQNSVAPAPLVLLLRGDVVRRYPSLDIYAQQAVFTGSEYVVGPATTAPSFRGDLSTDTIVVGFDDLTADTARGVAERTEHAGWFFILEEPMRTPRFGLDEPGAQTGSASDWAEATWAQLAPTDSESDRWAGPIRIADTNPGQLPQQPRWGAGAVETATALLQQPYRIAIHARRLLPSKDPR